MTRFYSNELFLTVISNGGCRNTPWGNYNTVKIGRSRANTRGTTSVFLLELDK